MKQIVEGFPVSQASLSLHLKELATAGLIDVWREAQCSHYRPRHGVLEAYLAEVSRRLGCREPQAA